MKPITLRGVPKEVERLIARRAAESGDSRNRVVIGLLEEVAGVRPPRKRRRHHDLDPLAGVWSRAEAKAFRRLLTEQRRIDSEIWE